MIRAMNSAILKLSYCSKERIFKTCVAVHLRKEILRKWLQCQVKIGQITIINYNNYSNVETIVAELSYLNYLLLFMYL